MTVQLSTLRPLVDPQSIAIIGASSDFSKIGGKPIKHLTEANYRGRILPVNPKYDDIAGLPSYKHISEVPGDIDLALIIVPTSLVTKTLKDCGERGVRSAIIITAGFAETGDEGKKEQDEITRLAKYYNMRVLGPNTVGMFNVRTGAFATFSVGPVVGEVPKGNIGIVSQSGAICGYLYCLSVENQIGLNYFLGTGNESDVDAADCIAYMAEDPGIQVIACYFEGSNNPTKLMNALELARNNKKPVIVLKSGRSEAGKNAVSAHTGSNAGSDDEYEAIFGKSGAYRVNNITDLLNVASACSFRTFPIGKRAAICTISGGAGVMLADMLTETGMDLPQPSKELQEKMQQLVPFASIQNPIDTTAQLIQQPKLMGQFMKGILDEVSYDMLLTFIGTQGIYESVLNEILSALKEVQDAHPEILILMSTLYTPETKKIINDMGIPVTQDLEDMAMVAKALSDIGANLMKEAPTYNSNNI